jgi:hypothetical protein
MDPETPNSGGGKSMLVDDLPPAAVDNVLEVAGADSGTSLFLPIELRQLGGALGRDQPGAGAMSRVDGNFLAVTGGLALPEFMAQTLVDSTRVMAALAPWSRGRRLLSFTPEQVDTSSAYDKPTLEKLMRVRTSVDPDGVLLANHEIRTQSGAARD